MMRFLTRLVEKWPFSWCLGTKLVASVKANNRYMLISGQDSLNDRWFNYRSEIRWIGEWIGDLVDKRDQLRRALRDLRGMRRSVLPELRAPFTESIDGLEVLLSKVTADIDRGMKFLDDIEQYLVAYRDLEDGPERITQLLIDLYASLEYARPINESRPAGAPDKLDIQSALSQIVH